MGADEHPSGGAGFMPAIRDLRHFGGDKPRPTKRLSHASEPAFRSWMPMVGVGFYIFRPGADAHRFGVCPHQVKVSADAR